MNATVTIDKAGRLVLPKRMRDALHLKPGTSLDIEERDGAIILRQPRPEIELVKQDGMWLVRPNYPLTYSIPELIDQHREERIQTLIRRALGEDGPE
jgi:AbrB family looped-hinge helix DNA binding protein